MNYIRDIYSKLTLKKVIMLCIVVFVVYKIVTAPRNISHTAVTLPENIIPVRFETSEYIRTENEPRMVAVGSKGMDNDPSKYGNTVAPEDNVLLYVLENGVEKTYLFDMQLGEIIREADYIPKFVKIRAEGEWVEADGRLRDIRFDGIVRIYNGESEQDIHLVDCEYDNCDVWVEWTKGRNYIEVTIFSDDEDYKRIIIDANSASVLDLPDEIKSGNYDFAENDKYLYSNFSIRSLYDNPEKFPTVYNIETGDIYYPPTQMFTESYSSEYCFNPYSNEIYLWNLGNTKRYIIGDSNYKIIFTQTLFTQTSYRHSHRRMFFPNGTALFYMDNGTMYEMFKKYYAVKIDTRGKVIIYKDSIPNDSIWSSDAKFGYYIKDNAMYKMKL